LNFCTGIAASAHSWCLMKSTSPLALMRLNQLVVLKSRACPSCLPRPATARGFAFSVSQHHSQHLSLSQTSRSSLLSSHSSNSLSSTSRLYSFLSKLYLCITFSCCNLFTPATMAPSSVASDDSGNDVRKSLLTLDATLTDNNRTASSSTLMQFKLMASELSILQSSSPTVTTQLLQCTRPPVATFSRSRVSVRSKSTKSRMRSRSAR
jgi:hypothetical protein